MVIPLPQLPEDGTDGHQKVDILATEGLCQGQSVPSGTLLYLGEANIKATLPSFPTLPVSAGTLA